jgi:hypothetical protein
VALSIVTPNYKQVVTSDYNAYWVPNGSIGSLSNLSTEGFSIPSPPMAKTLNQWRALTGLDMNSVEGNMVPEFVSTTPGSENLHIQPNVVGSIVGNRGVVIAALTTDIDGNPRGASSVAGRYDIGADEFTGRVNNFDLMAEDISAPYGYRASTGQYSDAEYIMSDSLVPFVARIRNFGGSPIAAGTVIGDISYLQPVNGSAVGVISRQTLYSPVDVSQSQTVSFGTFMPMTLRELGLTDPFYGSNPNVTPVYRLRVTTGTDDVLGNNVYTKFVRFYVQRSTREVMMSVENYNGSTVGAANIANKLNSDTLVAAMRSIFWDRADGVAKEDYDLFERDKWPSDNLNFAPWRTMVWGQGSESTGLLPQERAALKNMLLAGNSFVKRNLVIAGQDIVRIHDVALTASNGQLADRDFVNNYLRATYVRNTVPADYSGRRIRGVQITPGKYEVLQPTGFAGDGAPLPAVVRATAGTGIARAAHNFVDETLPTTADSASGVATAAPGRNVVFYSFDWRHAGRFAFEADRSGAQRLLLGAFDFIDQYSLVLPVKLVRFDAYQSAASAVSLEWATTSESEVSAMEIERATLTRSETGVVTGAFHVVDRTSPAGTPTRGANYQVVDRGVTAGSEYVYRLVTVNIEGARTVEAERQVKIAAGAAGYDLVALPNPMRTSGRIEYRVPTGQTVRVALFDAQGREVRELVSTASGSGVVELPVAELASGSYTVRLMTSSGAARTETVVIAK